MRGICILTMIASHSVFFFHTHTHPILQSIGWFADFISFTGLLFVSGATSYIAYIHLSHPTEKMILRVLRRLLVYLLGYWLLALWAQTVLTGLTTEVVMEIITFRHFVPFTEFLIPFLIYAVLKIPLRPIYQRIAPSLTLTSVTSITLYIVGVYGYSLPVPSTLVPLKAILAGHPGYYTFALLQYWPAYLFGMFIGHALWEYRSKHSFIPHLGLYATVILSGVGLATVYTRNVAIAFSRWPPAPGFILIGLAGAFIVANTLIMSVTLRRFKHIQYFFMAFGQNAFGVFFGHTALVYLYGALGFPRLPLFWHVATLAVSSAILSLYIARIMPFNFRIGLTWMKWCDCRLGYCTHSQYRFVSAGTRRVLGDIISLPSFMGLTIGTISIPVFSYWIPAAALSAFAFFTLPQMAVVPLGIHPAVDNKYIQIVQETAGKTQRRWFFVGDDQTTVDYVIEVPDLAVVPEDQLRVLYRLGDAILGDMTRDGSKWSASFTVDQAQAGEHDVTALFIINGRNIVSLPTPIIVTHPVYVTWTIDWEGYDVKPEYLEAMLHIADSAGVPLTHLFNPRIYTTDTVTPQRALELTELVKMRRDTKNEEIGLHLHMFPDFVSAAGVTPKTEPAWGGGFTYGYDILTSAYTKDEMKQILAYALRIFEQQGLGTPKSYRAGGWFASEDTLAALAESGFTVDSSGRTQYVFGTNRVDGPWELTVTQQPYYPSAQEQNSTGTQDKLQILEIPNNGADSFAFSSTEMIARFTANYPGGAVGRPIQVTYLSHPHWFHRERQDAMLRVFAHIDQWSYKNDKGPVVYTTLQGLYEAFGNNEL